MSDFRMTREHLALLRAAEWRESSMETGAPGIDPKRPFGFSDGIDDNMAEILGVEFVDTAHGKVLRAEDSERMWALFYELLPAIQWCIDNAPDPEDSDGS